jgi:succinate dehydrogenase hydrophobic anchor subunit
VTTDSVSHRIEKLILPKLEKLPVIAAYARSRGWPFVLSWIHRISGSLLVFYVLFHIYTLSFLNSPDVFDAKMRFFGFFIFVFLEWALAIPVIIHALNGGRLILYEIFGSRKDDVLMRWVWAMSAVYILLLAVMMIMGNQTVTPGFFWLTTVTIAACLVVAVGSRIWKTAASTVWKFQRISGAFLFIMVPAHMLFMHLNLGFGHEASVVVARMQNVFIKILDLGLLISVLFHGGYGLLSIAKDYIPSKLIQNGIALAIIVALVVFGWVGVKLTISI